MEHPPNLHLNIVPGELTVCRLPPDAGIPAWIEDSGFVSITRTLEELSIVCGHANVPGEVQSEGGWQALQIQGPLDFDLVGVLAAVANPLAAAGVSIFAISTYDTDYLLVRSVELAEAIRNLRAAGHTINFLKKFG